MGGGVIQQLDDLRGPMALIFGHITKEMTELERYRAKYGAIEISENEGSDTEQE